MLAACVSSPLKHLHLQKEVEKQILKNFFFLKTEVIKMWSWHMALSKYVFI